MAKSRILETLRADKGVVSGQGLSDRLGISRVAVWKHIRRLRECGYRIHATGGGYRLTDSPDIPYPWEFPEETALVCYREQVSSTMDEAREKARGGCPPFTVVVAGSQRQGRGRLDRSWVSDEGGLYFTVVLRPRLPPVLSARVNFAASLTLVRVLREMFDIAATVKWPNDILVGDGKLSGMLSEMEAEADRVAFVNVGIGLNANNRPTAETPGAVCLAGLLGRPVSRTAILSRFLTDLKPALGEQALSDVVDRWKACTSTLGRQVRVVTTRETVTGTAVDVDPDGSLMVRLADGAVHRVVHGDCFHEPWDRRSQPPPGSAASSMTTGASGNAGDRHRP